MSAADMALVPMTPLEARDCLARLKEHWQQFWFELKRFHDERGWVGLGYSSFESCMAAELNLSRQRAYQLIEAAAVVADLRCQNVLTPPEATEAHYRALKPLPPPARAEIARRTDFGQTPVRQLRATVERARAVLADLDDEDPDWDAVVSAVSEDPRVQAASLKHEFSKAVCRVSEGLLDFAPEAVAPLLDEPDRQDALLLVEQMRAWCDRLERALQQRLHVVGG